MDCELCGGYGVIEYDNFQDWCPNPDCSTLVPSTDEIPVMKFNEGEVPF